MKVFLFSLLLIASQTLRAEVSKISVITTEFDKNYSELFLETDGENKVHSLRYLTTTPNGSIVEDVTLNLDDVMDDGGALVLRDNREIVRVYVENFTAKNGGVIKLNYLYNGIVGSWNTKRLKLKKADGRFYLTDMSDRPSNLLYMTANTVRFVGVVGIREILTANKAEGI